MKTLRLTGWLGIGCQALYWAVPVQGRHGFRQYRNAELHLRYENHHGGFLAATLLQPAPFNGFCGTDILGNCSASWDILTTTVPVGDNHHRRHAQLGNIRPGLCGSGQSNRVFHICNGTDDLTTTINTVSEALEW